MRPLIPRNTHVRWFLLALTVCTLLLPGLVLARSDDIAALEKERDYFTIQCRIMEVHSDYLVVCEEIIELVEYKQGGKRYQTMLRDHMGRSISFSSFKKGQWVFIRMFELSNGHMGARGIYKLPREISSREASYYPFMVKAPEWEAQR